MLFILDFNCLEYWWNIILWDFKTIHVPKILEQFVSSVYKPMYWCIALVLDCCLQRQC